jgi:hypothetical protein
MEELSLKKPRPRFRHDVAQGDSKGAGVAPSDTEVVTFTVYLLDEGANEIATAAAAPAHHRSSYYLLPWTCMDYATAPSSPIPHRHDGSTFGVPDWFRLAARRPKWIANTYEEGLSDGARKFIALRLQVPVPITLAT